MMTETVGLRLDAKQLLNACVFAVNTHIHGVTQSDYRVIDPDDVFTQLKAEEELNDSNR